MDWITKLLASLFEAFKMKNPKVAAFILLMAATAVAFAEQGTLLGLISLPEWAAATVKWVGMFLLALTGSQTFQYISPAKQKAR